MAIKKDNPKTFSVWGFFGGLIIGYILFYILGVVAGASKIPLIALGIGSAIIVIFAILIMAYGIDKDEYVMKSAAIGMLGLVIGLVAAWLLKGVKGANNSTITS